jgi:hypothetical protein
VLAALAALLASAIPAARADGDPASDYLIEQQLFLPIDGRISPQAQRQLTETVRDATERGFPIRVALIWSPYDLGSVTALWRKPLPYARFLSAEITYFYKGRLLIVMPNGLGFAYPKHRTAAEQDLLARIPVTQTPTGLAQAATSAVTELAAARGVRVDEPGSRRSTTRDVLIAVGLALVAIPTAAVVLLFRQQRRRARV